MKKNVVFAVLLILHKNSTYNSVMIIFSIFFFLIFRNNIGSNNNFNL